MLILNDKSPMFIDVPKNISIHLMLILNFRYALEEDVLFCISIHLMLILNNILIQADTLNEHFNTSNVDIKLVYLYSPS